jgi:hypothetical protein
MRISAAKNKTLNPEFSKTGNYPETMLAGQGTATRSIFQNTWKVDGFQHFGG